MNIMNIAKRVLFISYSFPPSTEMGAYTCAQIARILPKYGWRPAVLTVKEKYLEEKSPECEGNDSTAGSALVIRTSRLPHPLRTYRQLKSGWLADELFRASDKQTKFSIRGERTKSTSTGKLPARNPLVSMLSCPDDFTGWLAPAVMAGLLTIGRIKAQAIYSSAPYFTNHLAGYALALLTGLPWVAHFRDPWITGASADYRPDDLNLRINRKLERMIIARANAVVCVTEEHAAELRAAYHRMPASKFSVVMNGFDGLEWEEACQTLSRSAPDDAGTQRKFRITYAAVRECYQSWKQKLPCRTPDPAIVESFDRRRTTGQIAELLNRLAT